MPDRLTIGVVCSRGIGPGRGGRDRNEDNYLVARDGEARFRSGDREGFQAADAFGTLLAVADGMGGHKDGDLASSAAVQAMIRIFRRGRPADPGAALRRFVLDAHHRLHRKASEHGPVRMGTTLTVAWVLDGRAWWVHVGDSRLYHYRDRILGRLTRDHTHGEFASRDGREPPEGAEALAQNFLYGSRGLGHDADIRVDPGLDTGHVDLEPGDRMLLCSDGLCGFVPDARIADVVRHSTDPQSAATSLMERALAAGSDDNVTVVVARVDEVEPPETSVERLSERTLVPR